MTPVNPKTTGTPSSIANNILHTSKSEEASQDAGVTYAASTRAFIACTLLLLNISLDHLVEAERMFSHDLYHHAKEDAEMKEKSEKLRKEKEEGWGGSWGRRLATAGGVTVSTPGYRD